MTGIDKTTESDQWWVNTSIHLCFLLEIFANFRDGNVAIVLSEKQAHCYGAIKALRGNFWMNSLANNSCDI